MTVSSGFRMDNIGKHGYSFPTSDMPLQLMLCFCCGQQGHFELQSGGTSLTATQPASLEIQGPRVGCVGNTEGLHQMQCDHTHQTCSSKQDYILISENVGYLKREVEYLGHIVSSNEVTTDLAKAGAVRDMPMPRCTREVHSSVELTSYYRHFK